MFIKKTQTYISAQILYHFCPDCAILFSVFILIKLDYMDNFVLQKENTCDIMYSLQNHVGKGVGMSCFKRFTDAGAVFAAISALIYTFCEFMGYKFESTLSMTEKVKLFLSDEPERTYRFYLPLVAAFIISFILSVAFHKFPHLTLAVSALPLTLTLTMFSRSMLYERPMLYVILAVAHSVGCLYECIRRDRLEGGRRGAIACDLLAICVSFFLIYVTKISESALPSDALSMNVITSILHGHEGAIDVAVLERLALFLAVCVAVRLIGRDLFYLDAALAGILLVWTVYVWNIGRISILGGVITVLVAVYAISRISVMLLCRPKRACVKNSKAILDDNTGTT